MQPPALDIHTQSGSEREAGQEKIVERRLVVDGHSERRLVEGRGQLQTIVRHTQARHARVLGPHSVEGFLHGRADAFLFEGHVGIRPQMVIETAGADGPAVAPDCARDGKFLVQGVVATALIERKEREGHKVLIHLHAVV